MSDWKIFIGDGSQHDGLKKRLPAPPPWRFSRKLPALEIPKGLDLDKEKSRADPFIPTPEMVIAVNAALYLRRPLLISGKPGTGKSSLISKVAYELMLGPVLRWPITSRSTVRSGMYEYDAVGRLQAGRDLTPPVEKYLTLGPLGTALRSKTWPRPLLIDEIDKSDLDFANDLLNVIEEGEYEIPELSRLGEGSVDVRDSLKETAPIPGGIIQCGHFPFVVMTSNAEREFPPPFLRRCVRLTIDPPTPAELTKIVASQMKPHIDKIKMADVEKLLAGVETLISKFDGLRKENQEVATDQLLNAVFLTLALNDPDERSFSDGDLKTLRENLFRQLSGPAA